MIAAWLDLADGQRVVRSTVTDGASAELMCTMSWPRALRQTAAVSFNVRRTLPDESRPPSGVPVWAEQVHGGLLPAQSEKVRSRLAENEVSAVGRVIPNAPVGHCMRFRVKTRATSLRRVGDNAPHLEATGLCDLYLRQYR